MTDLDLDAIQACTDAATPGPWATEPSKYVRSRYVTQRSESHSRTIVSAAGFQVVEPVDAEFIANARTWVPALVARVRELEGALDSMYHATEFSDSVDEYFRARVGALLRGTT